MLNLRCGTTGRCVRLSKFEGGRGLSPWVVYTACDPISLVEIFPAKHGKTTLLCGTRKVRTSCLEICILLGNWMYSQHWIRWIFCRQLNVSASDRSLTHGLSQRQMARNGIKTMKHTEPQGPQCRTKKMQNTSAVVAINPLIGRCFFDLLSAASFAEGEWMLWRSLAAWYHTGNTIPKRLVSKPRTPSKSTRKQPQYAEAKKKTGWQDLITWSIGKTCVPIGKQFIQDHMDEAE